MAADRGTPGRPEPPADAGFSDGRRGMASLLRDLAEGSAELFRQEVRLVRLELGALLATIGRGSISVALGSACLLIGTLAVAAGVIFVIGEQWIVGQYWLAALIVFLVASAVAAVFATRGARILSPRRLAPRETVATLTEDSEWPKRQLRSDATLS